MIEPSIARPALYVVVAAFFTAAVLPMAFLRVVDEHEGIELIAARLVMEGQVPYHDFFYPDMPLLPLLYAGWMALTGLSWYSARLLSALLAIALGLVLVRYVERTTGRQTSMLAALVFGVSGVALVRYPVAQAYVVVTLLVFLAFAIAETAPARWKSLVSGLCLGFAIDARIYLLALLPVFAVAAVRDEDGRRQLRRLLFGTAVGVVPNLYFIARGPEVWAFDVLRHHVAGGEAWHGGLSELSHLLGITGSFGAASLQTTLLFLVWLGSVTSAVLVRERLPRSTPIVSVLLLLNLLPSSTPGGYVYTMLPFLVAHAVVLIPRITDAVPGRDGDAMRRRLARALGTAVALYVVVAPVDMATSVIGEDVADASGASAAGQWQIAAINRVGRAVDQEMPPVATSAISAWPGYLVESRTRIFPGLENPLALSYAERLTPEQASRYHLLSHTELVAHIRAHTAPVVVLAGAMAEFRQRYGPALANSGYLHVRDLDGIEIYRWRETR